MEREEEKEEERAVKDVVRDHCIATADSVEDPEIPQVCYGRKDARCRLCRRCINSTFTRIALLATDPERVYFAPGRLFYAAAIREKYRARGPSRRIRFFFSSSANFYINLRSPRLRLNLITKTIIERHFEEADVSSLVNILLYLYFTSYTF